MLHQHTVSDAELNPDNGGIGQLMHLSRRRIPGRLSVLIIIISVISGFTCESAEYTAGQPGGINTVAQTGSALE